MGAFLYGIPAVSFLIDDRALAHLKLAIVQKLRRDESFTLTLEGGVFEREAIWLSPGIPMRFVFFDAVAPRLNRAWVDALAMSANSSGGLRLVDEPVEGPIPTLRPVPLRSAAKLHFGARR